MDNAGHTLHYGARDWQGQMQIVRLEAVSKNYDGVVVVRDLSLEVCSGEIVALLGQTGAGKSTILNMIMGQTAPSAGEVRINDLDPRGGDPKLRGVMAVSFQTDRLLPWRTAEQNVQLGLEYLGVSKARARRTRARLVESGQTQRNSSHQVSTPIIGRHATAGVAGARNVHRASAGAARRKLQPVGSHHFAGPP